MSGLTARGSRRGNACQAGAARASAAMARRIAALPQSRATGQADAMAILMRRTLMRTSAPIFKNLRRMVPQVALAKAVLRRPIRQQHIRHRVEPEAQLIGAHRGRRGSVGIEIADPPALQPRARSNPAAARHGSTPRTA